MRQISRKTLDCFEAFYASLHPDVKLRLEPAILLRDISLGAQFTTLVTQMNLLKSLIRRKGATPEVAVLARKVTKTSDQSRIHCWQARILQERIRNKRWEVIHTKEKWSKSSAWIRGNIPPPDLVSFNRIKREELEKIWQMEKDLKRAKLQKFTGRSLVSNYDGIPLTDTELARKFGDPDLNGLVIGGVEASDNVREFLKLDPKYRVFGKLDALEFELQTETTAYKQ